MKEKNYKEIDAVKFLKQLQKDYIEGNKDAWEIVKNKIDSIPGIDNHLEQHLKKLMKQHLGID